jgi:capsular polysaccharide biosynthesis protein
MMNDKDDKVMLSMYDGDHLAERPGADDYAYLEDGTGDLTTGLTSLEFIRATLRRTARLWGAIAAAGLLIGLGLFLAIPAPYKATTSLLLTPESIPGEPSGSPIANEVATADSRTVAELALQQLGLHESVDSFQKTYTVTAVTDRIVDITASAPTPGAAVNRANALATEFLRFRANVATAALALMSTSLSQQIALEQQIPVNAQISQLSAEPITPARTAELKKLKAEPAAVELATLEETSAASEAAARVKTEQAVHGSQVLDAASLNPTTRLRRFVEFVGIGLLAGLVLGIGFVLLRELLSDRLRRRDDIARALGAPVKLSVDRVPLSRWRPGARGLSVARSTSVQRVVDYLASTELPSGRGPASLAVVPVDDARVPAVCLASLAVQHARNGWQVVVADLCDGAPAARLLGVAGPGVQTTSVQGTQLTVVIPEGDVALAAGPLRRRTGRRQARPRTPRPAARDQQRDPVRLAPAAEPVITACASADLLLTLAALDPSLGAEHLAGWTKSAVAMVTGGQSSAARIHAVGEMIRLAGITLISGVLVGADKADQSLGTAPTPGADRDVMADKADRRPGTAPTPGADRDVLADDGLRDETQAILLSADRAPSGKLPDDY